MILDSNHWLRFFFSFFLFSFLLFSGFCCSFMHVADHGARQISYTNVNYSSIMINECDWTIVTCVEKSNIYHVTPPYLSSDLHNFRFFFSAIITHPNKNNLQVATPFNWISKQSQFHLYSDSHETLQSFCHKVAAVNLKITMFCETFVLCFSFICRLAFLSWL